MRRLEPVNNGLGVFKRRPIRPGVRRCQVSRDPVPTLMSKTNRVKRARISDPPLAGKIAAIQAIEQVAHLIRIGTIALRHEVIGDGVAHPGPTE